MNHLAKTIVVVILILPFFLNAQWINLGLGDKIGNKIEISNNKIYAGTNDGMYSKELGSNDTTWINLGLNGKRINDFIIFSPDTILATTDSYSSGSPDIYIFMTYDGGNIWNNYQNGFGGNSGLKSCSAIENNPLAPDTLYARNSMSIAKSIDQGVTWQVIYGGWGAWMSNHDLIFDVSLNGTIWCGGQGGFESPYLKKSTNFGIDWQNINFNISFGFNTCFSLVIHPTISTKILTSLEEDIILSNDGGTTWTESFTSTSSDYSYFFDMEISPDNDNLVYVVSSISEIYGGFYTYVYMSDDFGDSWDTINYLVSENNYYTRDIEIINTGEYDVIFFATSKGIYKYPNPLNAIKRNEYQNNYTYTVYPNPFYNQITIELNPAYQFIEVYDLNGKVVLSKNIIHSNNKTEQIELGNLIKGVYLLNIKTKEQSSIKKIVKI